jgi:hypothetical protein
MIKKDKKIVESNIIQNNKIIDRAESKTSEKNEKSEKISDIKTDKISRPVKWNKNKHSFVVSGRIKTFNI